MHDDAATGPAAPVGDFLADTQLRADPDVAGRWTGAISDAWKIIYAFGGMSMAVAIRGIERELDRPELDLRAAHATFITPIRCDAIEVDARVLRSGRGAAQGTADLRNVGDDGTALHASATFGTGHDSPVSFVDATFPAAAAPLHLATPPPPPADDDSFPELNYHQQTEWLPALPADHDWTDPDRAPAEALFGAWMRLCDVPRRADGTLDPLWLCMPGDAVGSAVGMALGGRAPDDDSRDFFTLTLELDLQVLRPSTTDWVLQVVRSPSAGDGYATGTVELWDEDHQLLAVASQLARLRHFTRGDGFLSS